MKSFILFLAVVCGGVSFLLYTDNQFVSGNWAGQICMHLRLRVLVAASRVLTYRSPDAQPRPATAIRRRP